MKPFLLAIMWALSVGALGSPLLRNDREGASQQLSASDVRAIEGLLARNTPAAFARALDEILPVQGGRACAFRLVRDWRRQTAQFVGYAGRPDLLIKTLRHLGHIDDVVMDLSLKAWEVTKEIDARLTSDAARDVGNDATLAPLAAFSQRRLNGECLHENFRELLATYRRATPGMTLSQLAARAQRAQRDGFLSAIAAEEIREAVRGGVADWKLSLQDYVTKKQFLRTQFPLTASEQRSDFVSSRPGRSALGHRARIYQNYTPIQISMLGDLIRRFRRHLDSPRIDIRVFDSADTVVDTISLDPMERFRFAIRYLRKEMRLLATHTYFSGQRPAYTDLMAAAFEMGIVTGSELDAVAALEEIWNPRQSWWDKSVVWVRMFASTLSVVVPAPYGFIPSLAIVAIQAVMREEPDDTTDSLF